MKQKRQIIVLVVLVVVAVLVWGYEWRGQSPSTLTAAQIQNYKPLGEENPSVHWGILKHAQETEYTSNGRNPFSVIVPPTPVELKAKRDAEDKLRRDTLAATPPPIPAPTTATWPPNLKYFGYANVPNEGSVRRAFFTDGDEVYIVTEGDTLLGRYRILKVGNVNLQFQEISSGLPGTAPLEEQAAPPAA
jgi:hypothetical protein